MPLYLWLSWLVALLVLFLGTLGGAYLGAWAYAEVENAVMALIGALISAFGMSPLSATRHRAGDQLNAQNERRSNG